MNPVLPSFFLLPSVPGCFTVTRSFLRFCSFLLLSSWKDLRRYPLVAYDHLIAWKEESSSPRRADLRTTADLSPKKEDRFAPVKRFLLNDREERCRTLNDKRSLAIRAFLFPLLSSWKDPVPRAYGATPRCETLKSLMKWFVSDAFGRHLSIKTVSSQMSPDGSVGITITQKSI